MENRDKMFVLWQRRQKEVSVLSSPIKNNPGYRMSTCLQKTSKHTNKNTQTTTITKPSQLLEEKAIQK